MVSFKFGERLSQGIKVDDNGEGTPHLPLTACTQQTCKIMHSTLRQNWKNWRPGSEMYLLLVSSKVFYVTISWVTDFWKISLLYMHTKFFFNFRDFSRLYPTNVILLASLISTVSSSNRSNTWVSNFSFWMSIRLSIKLWSLSVLLHSPDSNFYGSWR